MFNFIAVHGCESVALMSALFLGMCGAPAAEESIPNPSALSQVTLAGTWSGRWTDSRKAYNASGGNFSCSAIDKERDEWIATFIIGKKKAFTIALRGKQENGQILFNTAVDLGSFHGVYKFKGCVDRDSFMGEYDGPDEKGTFKMTKNSEAKLKE
jgi:hypothetical protein